RRAGSPPGAEQLNRGSDPANTLLGAVLPRLPGVAMRDGKLFEGEQESDGAEEKDHFVAMGPEYTYNGRHRVPVGSASPTFRLTTNRIHTSVYEQHLPKTTAADYQLRSTLLSLSSPVSQQQHRFDSTATRRRELSHSSPASELCCRWMPPSTTRFKAASCGFLTLLGGPRLAVGCRDLADQLS
uniref:COPIIcoated_ERV domain-containing protein n=1 Tax=Macrostomum lignano TaxID=282301 RepID=A0A1I8F743_9PLAT